LGVLTTVASLEFVGDEQQAHQDQRYRPQQTDQAAKDRAKDEQEKDAMLATMLDAPAGVARLPNR
jgi:hypothetical protein